MTIECIKINNPRWLPTIAPRISELVDKTKVDGISYETLYAYLAQTIQNTMSILHENGTGPLQKQDMNEFWVAFEESEPVGFAHWRVLGLPYVGMVHCDFIYSWVKNKDVAQSLYDEFRNFAVRHRCSLGKLDAINDAVIRLYKTASSKRGYELTQLGIKTCLIRRVET